MNGGATITRDNMQNVSKLIAQQQQQQQQGSVPNFPFDLNMLSGLTASNNDGNLNVIEAEQQLSSLIDQLQMFRSKLVSQHQQPSVMMRFLSYCCRSYCVAITHHKNTMG
ncbi:hypothetical protein BLA29_012039 [Euroglyphus maynei]|uniref:Uncharacterized protein n=1 Tax=Euroglyphus maynei TaxID=6958 RepID=A0A1Y3B3J9_EURMA|nr:hypothetical protein BLA29_012039 [Euroglyphus maynei]